MSTVAGVALACIASCLFNASVVIQAREARDAPPELGLRIGLIARLVRRPRWLAGIALNVLAAGLQTVALLLAPLTAVQPADAAGLALLLFLGSRTLGERVGRAELGAVGAIAVGVVLLTAFAPHREVTGGDGTGVLAAVAIVAALAAAPLALRRTGGITVVLGAGFAFALSAFAIKLVADAIDGGDLGRLAIAAGVVVVGALLGTVTEQTAFQHRPATVVAPIIFAVELLVPLALALIVVGERWSSAAPIALAVALVLAGAVVLARAPQVAGLMEE